MRRAEQLWIMVDVETSGPVYGTHSMTELSQVAVQDAEIQLVHFLDYAGLDRG